MGSFKNIYTDTYAETELARLRDENDNLREEVERLTQLADQYLTALLLRSIKEPISDQVYS